MKERRQIVTVLTNKVAHEKHEKIRTFYFMLPCHKLMFYGLSRYLIFKEDGVPWVQPKKINLKILEL